MSTPETKHTPVSNTQVAINSKNLCVMWLLSNRLYNYNIAGKREKVFKQQALLHNYQSSNR